MGDTLSKALADRKSALDELDRLRAENERLRDTLAVTEADRLACYGRITALEEALRPFVFSLRKSSTTLQDGWLLEINTEDLDRAARTLGGEDG